MSRKANPVYIGAFVFVALILSVATVVVVASVEFFAKNEQYVLYFESSVNGLEMGAPVKFKGVPVGRVTDIRIRWNQEDIDTHIPVFIEIDTENLANRLGVTVDLADEEEYRMQVMRAGLRGQLQIQSLISGNLYIELDYIPDAGQPYFHQERIIYKEIPTIPSALSEIGKTATNLAAQLSAIDLQQLSDEVSLLLTTVTDKVETFDVEGLNVSVQEAAQGVNTLVRSPRLSGALDNANALATELRSFIARIDENLTPLLVALGDTNLNMNETLTQFRQTGRRLEVVLGPESTTLHTLRNTLDDFSQAAVSLRDLLDELSRNPNMLITGKERTP